MMRLAEIDQEKVGKELMKMSIEDLSKKCNKLYFLKIGQIDNDIIDFINHLTIPVKYIESPRDYLSGWMFQNYESLQDLYDGIDEEFDWVLYPDADDILPDNMLDIIKEADVQECEVIRLYFVECFGSPNDILEVKEGFPIGPHFKAVKYKNGLMFEGSDGFNEPAGSFKRYESEQCMRHLRYATQEGIEKRKQMNYFQDYFLQNHKTMPYLPNQTFNYYRR